MSEMSKDRPEKMPKTFDPSFLASRAKYPIKLGNQRKKEVTMVKLDDEPIDETARVARSKTPPLDFREISKGRRHFQTNPVSHQNSNKKLNDKKPLLK